MRVQRLRAVFARGPEIKYITHLDLMRFWERALRRAGIEVAYSEGFSPHPQLSLAAPLPVGVLSSAELMDVFLARRVEPRDFLRELSRQLPPGLRLLTVEELSLTLPSIQSELRAAEYRVLLATGSNVGEVELRLRELLASESLPWQHVREKDVRSYDLRPLIHDLALVQQPQGPTLLMRLQADNEATGRPDQVVAALGLPPPAQIERTRLLLAPDLAREAVASGSDGAGR